MCAGDEDGGDGALPAAVPMYCECARTHACHTERRFESRRRGHDAPANRAVRSGLRALIHPSCRSQSAFCCCRWLAAACSLVSAAARGSNAFGATMTSKTALDGDEKDAVDIRDEKVRLVSSAGACSRCWHGVRVGLCPLGCAGAARLSGTAKRGPPQPCARACNEWHARRARQLRSACAKRFMLTPPCPLALMALRGAASRRARLQAGTETADDLLWQCRHHAGMQPGAAQRTWRCLS